MYNDNLNLLSLYSILLLFRCSHSYMTKILPRSIGIADKRRKAARLIGRGENFIPPSNRYLTIYGRGQ